MAAGNILLSLIIFENVLLFFFIFLTIGIRYLFSISTFKYYYYIQSLFKHLCIGKCVGYR